MPPSGRPTVVIATHNAHKVSEIRKILRGAPVRLVGLEKFPAYDVRETGRTLEANALLKARAAARRTGLPALSDDTGLEVAALRGAPGVYSARYAGPKCSFEDNNRKLLRALAKVRGAKRRALFRCVVAYARPDGYAKLFQGRSPGRIAEGARGNKGFGYDPVFAPGRGGKTFAEMGPAEKNRVSHRAQAFGRALAFLKKTQSSPRRRGSRYL